MKSLYLDEYLNKPIDLTGVKKLVMGKYFNSDILNYDELEYLEMGHYFNQKIFLPPKIKVVKCGFYFNQLFKSFPNSLEEFIMGECYDQELPNYSNNLKITYGKYFNK